MAIGVFDSGLGGLTVLGALQARMPEQAFVYLGDNAHAPYGVRQPQEIVDLTIRAVQALFDRGCRLVILACNTASAVALRRMQEYWVPADRRVLGVFVPVIEVIAGRRWADPGPPIPARISRVAFFATPATVRSGAFSRELTLRASGVEIVETACPGLVDALEAGEAEVADGIVRDACAAVLAAMPAPEAAVLGCTHYPLAEDAFRAGLPPGTRIVHQGGIVAESLCDYLARHPWFADEGPSTYLTTGRPADVRAQALRFLGRDIPFAAL